MFFATIFYYFIQVN